MVYWADIDDELAEFLGSDADSDEEDDEEEGVDEGMESDGSTRSGRSARSTSSRRLKRKRTTESINGSDAEDGGESTSALQKRRKLAAERGTTGLANVEIAENPSGLPSPDTTGPEEETDDRPKVNGEAVEEDSDGEFEREMMAEFERVSDDEE